MVRLVRAFNVGGSLTQLTVRRNEVLADIVPSLTVRVIVAGPNAFPAGVIFTVRLLWAPPKTMLVMGTRLESEEVAERISALAGVSASPMLNGIGLVAVSSAVVWLVIVEMVGRPLTAKTLLNPLANPDALAVSCLLVPATSISRLV